MANASNWGKAGLVFLEERDIDIVAATNLVVGAFEAMDHRISGVHILSDTSAQVSTDTHDLMLDLLEDVRPTPHVEAVQMCLNVKLASNNMRRISRFARDAILARCLQRLNAELEPDFIQWQDAAFLLPSDGFAAATRKEDAPDTRPQDGQSPSNVTHQTLPDVETTNVILQDRISNHDPQIFDTQSSPERLRKVFSDGWIDPAVLAAEEAAEAIAREMEDIEEAAPLRLSAWFMSFAVLLIALPVGVALLIINVAKGENLRLSSQTAALTGTFVALQATGATASAVDALQRLIA